MARRRTDLEKRPEAEGERFTPFAEVFTASADAHAGTDAIADGIADGRGLADRAEDPEQILAQPPDTRDISAELAAPPRARTPWLTLLLSGGVVAGLAFTGGALVEKDHLQGSAASTGRGFAAAGGGQGRTGTGAPGGGQRQGAGTGGQAAGGQGRTDAGAGAGTGQRGQRQGFGGATGGPGAGGGLTTGTVKLVDGTTLYVTDAQGNVVKVTTTTDTQITEAKSGKVSDLQPGQAVTVRGTQNASGDVAATTVAQGGAGGFTGGGRG
ncbi:DUF5666 domain-containing protein [Streptomyces sp. NPDC059708]|uniref:DUF5666 domain-containing protein n=1 Tax=Streptomyces sp. NPDC059708 TaxID=3346916 RepID=UPI0036C3C41A